MYMMEYFHADNLILIHCIVSWTFSMQYTSLICGISSWKEVGTDLKNKAENIFYVNIFD